MEVCAVDSDPEPTPGYHSSRWYSKHPEAQRPTTPTPNPERATEKKLHPVLNYFLRTLGTASLAFGGAGLMYGTSFLWSAVFIYVGLLILCVDPWLEPSLRNHSLKWRLFFSAPFLFCLVAFSWKVVLRPAPLLTE